MANAVQSLRSLSAAGLPKVAHLSLTQMRNLLSGSSLPASPPCFASLLRLRVRCADSRCDLRRDGSATTGTHDAKRRRIRHGRVASADPSWGPGNGDAPRFRHYRRHPPRRRVLSIPSQSLQESGSKTHRRQAGGFLWCVLESGARFLRGVTRGSRCSCLSSKTRK